MLTEHPHRHPGRQGYSDDDRTPTQVRHACQREATEADIAKQREAHRQEHIAIVAKALGRDRPMKIADAFDLAAVAVDALLADDCS